MPNPIDLGFLDARARLIDIAAFLDRVDRSGVPDDFRLAQFRAALQVLNQPTPGRAEAVLLAFSDPTDTPIASAGTQSACGAYPGPPAS
jgi:hypothetical protein